MADVKVTMSADAKPMLDAIKQAEAELKKFKQAAKQMGTDIAGGGGVGGFFGGMAKRLFGAAAVAASAKQVVDAMQDLNIEIADKIREGVLQQQQRAKAGAGAGSDQARGLASAQSDELERTRMEIKAEREKRVITSPIEWIKSYQRVDLLKEKEKKLMAEMQQTAAVSVNEGKRELEIQIKRTQGKALEADQLQRNLDYERERKKLAQDMINATPQLQKEAQDRLAMSKMAADAGAAIAREESMGITQVASSKAQLGLGGGVAIIGRNPNEAVLKQQLQVLEEIKIQLQKGQPTNTPTFSKSTPRGS